MTRLMVVFLLLIVFLIGNAFLFAKIRFSISDLENRIEKLEMYTGK